MAVTILILGSLRDAAGRDMFSASAPLDWAGLLNAVGPAAAGQMGDERVLVACDGKVLPDKTKLKAQDGQAVALLSAVSGG